MGYKMMGEIMLSERVGRSIVNGSVKEDFGVSGGGRYKRVCVTNCNSIMIIFVKRWIFFDSVNES